MCLACRVLLPPTRDANFKLTFETEQDAVPLGALFKDMCAQAGADADATKNAISFEYWFTNGCALASPASTSSDAVAAVSPGALATATVLVSKKKGSYRVQSTVLAAMWLVADELCRRLDAHFAATPAGAGVRYAEPLPLSDYGAAVDAHHAARKSVRQLEASLNDVAHEHRVIEKRVLVRFKDSRPAPLEQLGALLRQTHEKLLSLAERVEAAQRAREKEAHALACSSRLLLLLARLKYALTNEETEALARHFCVDVLACNATPADDAAAGWEELCDAALTFLLKTALAKQSKSHALEDAKDPDAPSQGKQPNAPQLPPAPLAFPASTEKLKRHIAMVCKRLDDGARPQGVQRPNTKLRKARPTDGDDARQSRD